VRFARQSRPPGARSAGGRRRVRLGKISRIQDPKPVPLDYATPKRPIWIVIARWGWVALGVGVLLLLSLVA
jgi:hypothetical protein